MNTCLSLTPKISHFFYSIRKQSIKDKIKTNYLILKNHVEVWLFKSYFVHTCNFIVKEWVILYSIIILDTSVFICYCHEYFLKSSSICIPERFSWSHCIPPCTGSCLSNHLPFVEYLTVVSVRIQLGNPTVIVTVTEWCSAKKKWLNGGWRTEG